MTGIDEPAAAEAVGTVLVEPEGSTGVEGESEKLASGPGRADAGNGGDSPRTFNKQRRGVLAMAGVALALGAVGCGVSEEQFNAASSEAENLKSENRKLERENGRLKKELAAGSVAEEHDPEPVAKLIGVTVADGRYVPAGMILTSQEDADNLPVITPDYGFATINAGVIHVNHQLATGYGGGGGEAGGHE